MNDVTPQQLIEQFETARRESLDLIQRTQDMAELEEAKIKAMGRKSPLSRARSSLRSVPDEHRKELGQRANDVQNEINSAIDAKTQEFAAAERQQRWVRERVDVTLPGNAPPVGGVHPLTRTVQRIVEVFIGLGYRVADGPEAELTKYNFDALNSPPEHPARSPQDTYYIAGTDQQVCLRSQTSPVQMRTLEVQAPPVYVLAPGRCYRRDVLDPTHLNSFTQVEGLAVDEGITMGDLKGTLEVFAHEVFGGDLDVRFRPSFFPFTEPSAEMDVQCFVCRGSGCRVCKNEGWIEILGCGMVDPFLLEWSGHDPEKYTGFAFGVGVERVAALVYEVPDIRYFYENDLRFLDPFSGVL
ncbi:MAG TPA: phenylalanine--tRNA ligase subunit alpha [Actinomycetota bacterium]|nr:phenylalanine--tRNA ligase subunit alpha [Actinomycetota bacterium]